MLAVYPEQPLCKLYKCHQDELNSFILLQTKPQSGLVSMLKTKQRLKDLIIWQMILVYAYFFVKPGLRFLSLYTYQVIQILYFEVGVSILGHLLMSLFQHD